MSTGTQSSTPWDQSWSVIPLKPSRSAMPFLITENNGPQTLSLTHPTFLRCLILFVTLILVTMLAKCLFCKIARNVLIDRERVGLPKLWEETRVQLPKPYRSFEWKRTQDHLVQLPHLTNEEPRPQDKCSFRRDLAGKITKWHLKCYCILKKLFH